MFNSIKPCTAWVATAWLIGCMPMGHAQTISVGELIAKSKAAKTLELQGLSAPKPSTNPPAVKVVPKPASKQQLWSITGVDDKLTAVLLHQQKAYTVHSTLLPADVGPWQVTEITDHQVWVKETKAVGHKRQLLVLEAPDKDTKLEVYLQALNKATGPEEGMAQLMAHPPGTQAAPLPAPVAAQVLGTKPATP
jgi:hypothetical protein